MLVQRGNGEHSRSRMALVALGAVLVLTLSSCSWTMFGFGPRGHDSVTGDGTVFFDAASNFRVGAQLDVRSGPNGRHPTGTVTMYPGSFFFTVPDSGPVTCVRVDGNRATIGFTAEPPSTLPGVQAIPMVIFVEDNGATGDRFSSRQVDNVTGCPAATDADFPPFDIDGNDLPPVVTAGDFVVHDRPSR